MPSRSSGVTESWSRFRTVIVREGVYGRAVKEMETSGELTVRSLAPETRDAFASLAERHNGVWAGGAQPLRGGPGSPIPVRRNEPLRYDRHVRAGRALKGF